MEELNVEPEEATVNPAQKLAATFRDADRWRKCKKLFQQIGGAGFWYWELYLMAETPEKAIDALLEASDQTEGKGNQMPEVQQQCGNCRFWKQATLVRGYCRRLPPGIAFFGMTFPVQAEAGDGVWPMTKDVHWCGEWRSEVDYEPTVATHALCPVCGKMVEIVWDNSAGPSIFHLEEHECKET